MNRYVAFGASALVLATSCAAGAGEHAQVAATTSLPLDPVQQEAPAWRPPATTTTTTAAPPKRASRSAPRPAPARPPQSLAAILACIRRYESGGNYRAVSPSGKYRGAYQADRGTWGGYAGYETADQAPPEVQDAWAAELYRRRGLRPWPTPSRRCA